METLWQFLIQTPLWAWAILVYLLIRGIKARRPAHTTLGKIAIIPVLLTAWGMYDLIRHHDLTAGTIGTWLLGIAAGAAIGWRIVARFDITADRATGTLHRPADLSLLPLLLVTFAVKYAFGVIAAVNPALLATPVIGIADIVLSGLFSGIFIGKFLRYQAIWRAAAQPAAPQS